MLLSTSHSHSKGELACQDCWQHGLMQPYCPTPCRVRHTEHYHAGQHPDKVASDKTDVACHRLDGPAILQPTGLHCTARRGLLPIIEATLRSWQAINRLHAGSSPGMRCQGPCHGNLLHTHGCSAQALRL